MATDPDAATLVPEGSLAEAPSAAGAAPEHALLAERYELLGLLGSGGMGNVYRARDLELEEEVALKVLRPELVASPEALERFRLEVKLARKVTHPNVARVFDIGERGGERILTMELVDGEPLSALLEREGRLSLERALAIALGVCAGVGAAHEAGVVHRDLKPDNVLLSRAGRAMVTDFGIACAMAASRAAVTEGGLVGTPSYMAPEQVLGSASIDARADVYAFGVMLYEMLTGTAAWEGDSALAVATARLLSPPPDPRAKRPELPAGLAELVLRCMAREPAARPESMALVARALEALAPTSATRPVPLPPRAEKRVAVLPFRNQGPPEQEYVADALTEDLIDMLSVAPGLRVHSRGVVMALKGRELDPRAVGRELGVQVVVEGAVRKGAGGFRISARVVSVEDGYQLWAQRFDGPDAQLLALNDEVARAVAGALSVPTAHVAHEVSDAETLDLYLRARAQYHLFYSRDYRDTTALFERLLARAPEDPRVIAGYLLSRSRGPQVSAAEGPRLLLEAERALRLAPLLPDAHVAYGTILLNFVSEALALKPLRRAVQLTQNCAEAHDPLGRVLSETGSPAGRAHLELALSLEPTFEFARAGLSRDYALAGEWTRALEVLEGAGFPARARYCLWRRDRAGARELLERPELGAKLLGPIGSLARTMLEVTLTGHVVLRDVVPENPALKRRNRLFLSQLGAEFAASVGDTAEALEALERGDALGLIDRAWVERCPLFEGLRAEPRFAAVRERVEQRALAVIAEYEAPLS